MAGEQSKAIRSVELIDAGFLRKLALEAGEAVFRFWDNSGTFWRSTEHRAREKSHPGFYPTVTFRSMEVLLRLLEECPDWVQPRINDALVGQCVPGLLERNEKDFRSSLPLPEGTTGLNIFTSSLYISTLARICEYHGLGDEVVSTAAAKLNVAAAGLVNDFKTYPEESGQEAHPFLVFHVLRAIGLCCSSTSTSSDLKGNLKGFAVRLLERLRAPLGKMLALHSAGLLSPAQAVALAFSAASLGLWMEAEEYAYAVSALSASFKYQEIPGCWPLTWVIPENKDVSASKPPLEISTYEVAWALAEATLSIARNRKERPDSGPLLEAVHGLIHAARYAVESIIQLSTDQLPSRGWCSDHAYGRPIIESWTSAIVLHSAISLQLLVEEINRAIVLRSFASADPRSLDWPEWLRWKQYRFENEPEEDCQLLNYLEKRLIEPILRSPGKLPRKKDRTVSVLLFGPPGTQKTTIVKAVADGLGWPVLILSPGVFIERGLEYIEAQAQTVFDLLHKLSHVIVLFDECDELFRDRQPKKETEQLRGIAAFVTASMLPRLQELHDRGRVVFFICTNHFESMDSAIKRGGRIDHIIAVAPPDGAARIRILRCALERDGKLGVPFMESAFRELATHAESFTRPELERAAYLLATDCQWESESVAQSAARRVAERLKTSLTITISDLEQFAKDMKFSHPHVERG